MSFICSYGLQIFPELLLMKYEVKFGIV